MKVVAIVLGYLIFTAVMIKLARAYGKSRRGK